jgi:two-component system, chemotaxis family, response regulator Rcp1
MRTIRLLVVEDSRAYLSLIERAFRKNHGKWRWEVATASNGEEALHTLFEEETLNRPLPDLILLDWNLPKISGGEVLRRNKEHERPSEDPRACLFLVLS